MFGKNVGKGASGAVRRDIRGPVLAVACAVLVATFLVLSVSRAAFIGTTSNEGNSLTSGTITLTDDDSGSTMFTVSNMMPGDSEVRCIVVTYSGVDADPSAVELYSGGFTDSGDFASYLNLTVEEGTGGAFGDCSGFTAENTIESGGTLAAFDAAHTDYASGVGVWDPASTPESKTYRFTIELDAGTPDTEQGESVTALIFTWEVQS
jgi:hypothetical protein